MEVLRSVLLTALAVPLSFLDAPAQTAQLSKEYASESDIQYFEMTSLGTLLVSTKESTFAINEGLEGAPIWTSRNLRDCKTKQSPIGQPSIECKFNNLEEGTLILDSTSPYAYFKHRNGFGVINLENGQEWLRSTSSEKETCNALVIEQRVVMILHPVEGRHGSIAALDLKSGREIWKLQLPFITGLRTDWRAGWGTSKHYTEEVVVLGRSNPLLLAGETGDKSIAVAAIDLNAGRQIWIQDKVPQFLEDPKNILKQLKVNSYLRSASVFSAGPSALIVVPSVRAPGGEPFALDRATGRILWKAAGLYKKHDLCPLYCAAADDRNMYVAHDQRLTALNVQDGSVRWTKAPVTGGLFGPLMTTSRHGLLTGCIPLGLTCRGQVEMINNETGKPVWPAVNLAKNSKAQRVNASIMDPDEAILYAASDGKLRALKLDTGEMSDLGDIKFKFDETPSAILLKTDSVVVASDQNVATFRRSGGAIFVRSFEAPKTRFWTAFAKSLAIEAINFGSYYAASQSASQQARQNAALNAMSRNSRTGTGVGSAMSTQYHPKVVERYSRSLLVADYNFIYTSEPDASGKKGYSLVQIRNTDGAEISRAWVNERNPDLVLDPLKPVAYVRRDDKRIAVFHFENGK